MPSLNAASAIFVRYRWIRFILVGGLNTGFRFGVYSALLFAGLDYRFASLTSLLLGIAFSFLTQSTIVFRKASKATLVKFVLAWIAIYGLYIWLISILLSVGSGGYLAGAIAGMPVTVVSYSVLKYAVFGRPLSVLLCLRRQLPVSPQTRGPAARPSPRDQILRGRFFSRHCAELIFYVRRFPCATSIRKHCAVRKD
jgi:putative flippase GtrA